MTLIGRGADSRQTVRRIFPPNDVLQSCSHTEAMSPLGGLLLECRPSFRRRP